MKIETCTPLNFFLSCETSILGFNMKVNVGFARTLFRGNVNFTNFLPRILKFLASQNSVNCSETKFSGENRIMNY